MPVSRVAEHTFSVSDTGIGPHTITNVIPATVEPGDLLVLFVGADSRGIGSMSFSSYPSGWTLAGFTSTNETSTAPELAAVLYRVAVDGDAGANAVTTASGQCAAHGFLVAYRGADASSVSGSWDRAFTPIGIQGYNTTAVDFVAGDLVIHCGFCTGNGVVGVGAVGAVSTTLTPRRAGGQPGGYYGWGYLDAVPTTTALSSLTVTATSGSGIGSLYAFVLSAAETVPETTAASAGDRLRSSISETTGSLLRAVDVRAVDASVSEAYSLAQELEPATLTAWREVLRERDSATVDFAYYPRPRQNNVMENQYEGVTVLSRLASYYPARVFDAVDNTGLGIVVSGAATAQQVITYLLETWAADVGWLTYEPVPDLRIRLANLAPSDYDTVDVPRIGVARTLVLAFPQDRTNRKNALEILQALLSPFPGTILRQNGTGKLQIVPTYGPDADETPALVLDDYDAYGVTIGSPDPFGIVNRATVSSAGYQRAEDVELMQPAWFQVGSTVQFGRSNWFTPPVNRVNLQPFESDTASTYQETLATSDDFNLQRPTVWPIAADRIPAGDGISLVDSVGDPLVTIAWARYFNDSLVSSGTNGLTILEPVIPFSGAWVTALSVAFSTGGEAVNATIRARWNESAQGVELGLTTPMKLETDCFTGCNGVIIEFTLNDASVGYTQTAPTTATFGFIEDDDTLPAVGGGNAIEDSQTDYGIREANINIEGYVFDAVTLKNIAQGYVTQNITPKVVREIDLSTIGTRLTFDAIGRLVQLPNTEQGRVIGRTYADDFVTRTWQATAQVEVANPLGAGALDTSTAYHTTEGNAFWTGEGGAAVAREEQP